jgi:predicted O-methyltransferase YrrM
MFHNLPEQVKKRMKYLEELNEKINEETEDKWKRLRQVPPETGRFLCLVAANAPQGEFVEIGTSGGNSALWLSQVCRLRGVKLTTYELLEEKAKLAQETFRAAGIEDVIELVQGDAREHLAKHEKIAFCFLDAEKDVYEECYDAVVPKLVKGGLLVGDNFLSHKKELEDLTNKILADERVDALLVPIGKGELVCRKR